MTAATLNTEAELRDAQWALMDRLYDDDAEMKRAALANYDANIERAGELGLLDTMHCNDIDPDAFNLYSDCYKSENNFRPRGFINSASVQKFLESRRVAA